MLTIYKKKYKSNTTLQKKKNTHWVSHESNNDISNLFLFIQINSFLKLKKKKYVH